MNYKTTIGIEIHLELLTNTKMFSAAPVAFGLEPNTAINENVMGYPGSLPTVNKKAVELAIQGSHLLGMNINQELVFDRKHYFYHDLPKGFQITQQFNPIGTEGKIRVFNKEISIERLHMEEDTAKTIRKEGKILLDYNRSGNPLIEIVTKPNIHSAKEAVEYINKVKELMLYAGISNAKMEEGSMRCDINISLALENSKTLGTKVEIKNINSTNNVKKAIEFEIQRQTQMLNNYENIIVETRKFDENTQSTIMMREKTSITDYNYMREPNIAPITLSDSFVKNAIKGIHSDSREIRKYLISNNYLEKDVNNIMSQPNLKNYIIHNFKTKNNTKEYYKLLLNDFSSILNKSNTNHSTPELFNDFVSIVTLENKPQKVYKVVLKDMIEKGDSLKNLFKKYDIELISDASVIKEMVKSLITTKEKEEYVNRPERVEKFLMGQIMKQTQGNVDAKIAIKIIKDLLK